MITELCLENFKCFEEISISLGNVNILSGINGMGKSTVLQSLLLLRQSYLRNPQMQGLYLNDRYVNLGNAQDVLYEKAESDIIRISYKTLKGDHVTYDFQYKIDSDCLPLSCGVVMGTEEALFDNRFTYLSAYRIQPQELYRIANEEELKNREFGNNGEFALQYLGMMGDEVVSNEKVVISDKLGNTLKNQTRLWLDKIAPGVSPQVMVNPLLRTSEVRYEFIEGKEKTTSYKSMNVGFGITYVLPVIVAILSAKPGDILLLENPEAHIHPAGQRALGELIALAGAGGVQLLVETHSDHILNGIRIAVKEQRVARESVKLVFFYKDIEDSFKHKYVSPSILPDGRLDVWPEGFFDEWDKELYALI
uniref:AAA family ATPase n=1 Tax=Acetatifactor sp. TaxID=1872090 RepID=UPI0040571844